MRVLLLILLSFVFTINSSFAYELILPKEKKINVNNKYVFFVGSARKNESLTINDKKIYTAPNGAFAHSVKLKDGENRILVKSNYDYGVQVYRVYKDATLKLEEPKLIEFEPKVYKVKKDKTPMRSTPVDFGMNRVAL